MWCLWPSRGQRPWQSITQYNTERLTVQWLKVEKCFELLLKAELMKIDQKKFEVTYFMARSVSLKQNVIKISCIIFYANITSFPVSWNENIINAGVKSVTNVTIFNYTHIVNA